MIKEAGRANKLVLAVEVTWGKHKLWETWQIKVAKSKQPETGSWLARALCLLDTQLEGLLSWAAYNPEIQPPRAHLSRQTQGEIFGVLLVLQLICMNWWDGKIFVILSWCLAVLPEEQTEEKHRCFALKINCLALLSFNFEARSTKRRHEHGKSLAELEDYISTGRRAAEYSSAGVFSVKFSAPSDSLCVWSIFYSLAAEAWGDKGHVAFQVALKSK